jgi:diguanylate cyclase (GGDEF)-like protein
MVGLRYGVRSQRTTSSLSKTIQHLRLARDATAPGPTSHLTWVQRQQIDTYFSLLPASVAGNLVNAGIIVWLFAALLDPWIRYSLIGAALAIAALRMHDWLLFRRHGIPARREQGLLTKIKVLAALNGAIWGITLLTISAFDNQHSLGFIGMVAAGMMCAGAISFAVIRAAAWLFILILASCMATAFIASDEWFSNAALTMLIIYTVVLLKAVNLNYSNVTTRVVRERQLHDSAETVSMLLNEFEENGSDWLWEVDELGRIIKPSPRFGQAAVRPAETLEGLPLIGLFEADSEARILRDHIEHMRSFRDLALQITIDGTRRWWSLSGRPVPSDDGLSRHMRGVATDISSTKHAESRVAYLAHYDGLTNLPNRILFNDTINHALNSRRNDAVVAVLSIDLDQFKSVNDTLGHPAGDALLRVVSRRIEACLQPGEIVARLGGDEFAVLLPGATDRLHAEVVAQRILEALGEAITIEGQPIICGASIGVALAPEDGTEVDILMKNVDLALYAAKANGRNRHAFFERRMDEAARTRRQIDQDLRSAVANNELELYFQPVVDIQTCQPKSYEALLRWNHPQRGLIVPADFIGIAEETGLIIQVGEWVLDAAVLELTRLPRHVGVSVNVSAAQMKSSRLIAVISQTLANHEVDPGRLEIEITESVLMEQSEINLATLHKLRSMGVRIALDDFGTGYSSLNYLRSFPFNKIKIDRCFVREIDIHEDCRAIIRAIMSLATSLGMTTTAEGVEDAEQLQRLKDEGCMEAQGYLFGAPRPAAEIPDRRSEGSENLTQSAIRRLRSSELLTEASGMWKRRIG